MLPTVVTKNPYRAKTLRTQREFFLLQTWRPLRLRSGHALPFARDTVFLIPKFQMLDFRLRSDTEPIEDSFIIAFLPNRKPVLSKAEGSAIENLS
jgi:hypothetical protein